MNSHIDADTLSRQYGVHKVGSWERRVLLCDIKHLNKHHSYGLGVFHHLYGLGVS